MPIELDGLKVLRAIVEAPTRFPAALKDVNKVGHSLLAKQVKAVKTAEDLVDLNLAVGSDSIALVVEGFSDRDLTALVKRVDRHNAEAATMTLAERRMLLIALGEQRAQPASAPAKPSRARGRSKAETAASTTAKAAPVEGAKRTMRSASMGAVREKKK